jgi:hypothetical protein
MSGPIFNPPLNTVFGRLTDVACLTVDTVTSGSQDQQHGAESTNFSNATLYKMYLLDIPPRQNAWR